MIVCKLELWPGGVESRARRLGEIRITNDFATTLDSTGKRGTYNVEIFKKRATLWKKLTLRNFPRLSYHPWNMIREILNDAAEGNNGRI